MVYIFTMFISIMSPSINIHYILLDSLIMNIQYGIHSVYNFVVHICVAGSKKKGLIRTYTSCPAFTHNKQKNHDCGYRHMSKAILDSMSMQEHRNHQAKNKGKNHTRHVNLMWAYKESIAPFSRRTVLMLQ